MRLYVIGPVTGRPDGNRQAFEGARWQLEEAGYEARIPHDFVPPDADWQTAMRISVIKMLSFASDGFPLFDGVAALPGSLLSRGAATEGWLCKCLGIPVWPVEAWIGEEVRNA